MEEITRQCKINKTYGFFFVLFYQFMQLCFLATLDILIHCDDILSTQIEFISYREYRLVSLLILRTAMYNL